MKAQGKKRLVRKMKKDSVPKKEIDLMLTIIKGIAGNLAEEIPMTKNEIFDAVCELIDAEFVQLCTDGKNDFWLKPKLPGGTGMDLWYTEPQGNA